MDSEQRFIDLESKIAHQDHLMEELHLVIYEQQKTIDKLEEKFTVLVKRLKDSAVGEVEIGSANEKPPHY